MTVLLERTEHLPQHLPLVALMLGHRRRRLPNIKATRGRYFALAGMAQDIDNSSQC